MVSANLVYSITYARRKKIGDIEHCAADRGVGWHLRGYVAAAYLRGLWGKNTGMFGGMIFAKEKFSEK